MVDRMLVFNWSLIGILMCLANRSHGRIVSLPVHQVIIPQVRTEAMGVLIDVIVIIIFLGIYLYH